MTGRPSVYLAASYSRKEEMGRVRSELNKMGIRVNSRWLDESEMPETGREKWLMENACIDVEDVLDSDILIRFTDDLSFPLVYSHLATGARFFEMGIAWMAKIPVIVVGGKQCIFDNLNDIKHLKDVAALKRYLSPYVVQ